MTLGADDFDTTKKKWSISFLHLSDNVIMEVGQTITAIGLWRKLKDRYRTKTLSN